MAIHVVLRSANGGTRLVDSWVRTIKSSYIDPQVLKLSPIGRHLGQPSVGSRGLATLKINVDHQRSPMLNVSCDGLLISILATCISDIAVHWPSVAHHNIFLMSGA